MNGEIREFFHMIIFPIENVSILNIRKIDLRYLGKFDAFDIFKEKIKLNNKEKENNEDKIACKKFLEFKKLKYICFELNSPLVEFEDFINLNIYIR